jgi:hypothetical protein
MGDTHSRGLGGLELFRTSAGVTDQAGVDNLFATATFYISLFDIALPGAPQSLTVELDDTLVDPSRYSLVGHRLSLTLGSEYGPFVKDLIVTFRVPEPTSLWLVVLGWRASRGGSGIEAAAAGRELR